ncbi:MAG TPA: pyridoxal phosphate-dependent aminotransferase [Williamwhitmania sp.]|nr:pyridoxal phosphate-dependent aminotransferase [Williamwhitmania sp.]
METYRKPKGSLISYFSNKVKNHGGINLAQGIPGFAPPPELLESLQQQSLEGHHQYAPSHGDSTLLAILAARYSKTIDVTTKSILIVQGATEALNLVIIYLRQLLNRSFTVMSFDPSYESYKNLPPIYGCKFVAYPLNENNSFDPEELRLFMQKNDVKLLFYASPGNPYGKVFTKEETDALLTLSREEDIFIAIDAVYRELYFEKRPYIPIESFNHRIFYINSFSKVFSITGWRIGYLIAHQIHMPAIRSIHDYTGLCAPNLFQKALADYLPKNHFGRPYVEGIREILGHNFTTMKTTLQQLGFSVPRIDGGYFVWGKLPAGFPDGFKTAMKLYENQELATIPGEHFSDRAKDYLRLNIARPEEEVEEACRRLTTFFSK